MSLAPVGVLTRSVGSFFVSAMMGGYDEISAASGNTGYVVLFNNSTQGQYLWVLHASIGTTNSQDALFEIIQGNPGGTAAPLAPTPIVSNGPILPGVMAHFLSNVCVGTHIGAVSGLNLGGYNWPHDWPICVVAPGQAFGVQTVGTFSGLSVGLAWMVGPQP